MKSFFLRRISANPAGSRYATARQSVAAAAIFLLGGRISSILLFTPVLV